MPEPTYLSLFSGIGGLDLAIEEAFGARCVGQVEWDESCQRVLARHWPRVPIADNAFIYDPTPFAGTDIVCAGWPCQPHSVAGKQLASSDPREGWPAVLRTLVAVRPRVFVGENVGRIRGSEAGRYFGRILADLAALGFDARWGSVRASDVGAPHRRERVFLVAYTDDGRRLWPSLRSQGLSGLHPEDPRPQSGRATRRPVAYPEVQRSHRGGQHGSGGPDLRTAVADTRERQQPRAGPDGDGLSEPTEHGAFPWGPYAAAIERWERVMGPAPHPVDERNRLSPDFVGWMMGFPLGWNEGQSRTNRLKQFGNAVVSQQALLALSLLTPDEEGSG